MLNHKDQTPFMPFQLATSVAAMANEKKASDIQVLDLQNVSPIADYFVIATVDSRPQMQALANAITDYCKKTFGLHPKGIERDQNAPWTLLDFGDVVLHLFGPDSRHYYELESFWNHATTIPEANWDLKKSA